MSADESKLTHADASGKAKMVDVGDKPPSTRRAVAEARVRLPREAFEALRDNALAKGDALAIARLAGIQAAKETARLIPLCHQLPLSHVQVDFELDEASSSLRIEATARTEARTGVEMEAMTAVSVAALALYDTAKSVSKGIVVESLRLLSKEGGKSGTWTADPAP